MVYKWDLGYILTQGGVNSGSLLLKDEMNCKFSIVLMQLFIIMYSHEVGFTFVSLFS